MRKRVKFALCRAIHLTTMLSAVTFVTFILHKSLADSRSVAIFANLLWMNEQTFSCVLLFVIEIAENPVVSLNGSCHTLINCLSDNFPPKQVRFLAY